MNQEYGKIKSCHLLRDAYLYVRQSSLRQVVENTESTERQYALQQKAISLGWKTEQVIVIDNDLGQSGASSENREGFQRLVADVGMGKAGIVLGLEVSRLARNSSDWHRLLEICALTSTLILDEDGLYDPANFNDRLLLGLKGTMSEAELHVLHARLRGGILNKAKKGELKIGLPVGLSYDTLGRVILDPDTQVQTVLKTFFDTYERTGTASATVKYFRENGLLFPRRLRRGIKKGQLVWGKLNHSHALSAIHNPRYAGTYVYGRTQYTSTRGIGNSKKVPMDEWKVILPDAHPGYISWEQYHRNLKQLRETSQAHGHDRRKSPPNEGPALLQGLVVCKKCGHRMTIRYHSRKGTLAPDYVCQIDGIQKAEPICQSIPGKSIDAKISEIILEVMTRSNLNISLQVQKEMQGRLNEADRLRKKQVERARYEADLAQERFMQVDPRNRHVADVLEADWNEKLRAIERAKELYEEQREADLQLISSQKEKEVLKLAEDFPKLWEDPKTSNKDKKRMIRHIVEDVTLLKTSEITMNIRFRGGATKTISIPKPLSAGQFRKTDSEVVKMINGLLDNYTEKQIAEKLNEMKLLSGEGKTFSLKIVKRLRRDYNLKTRYDRLREKGLLTLQEIAKEIKISETTVKTWRLNGLLKAYPYNGRNECLYEPIDSNTPQKSQGQKYSERRLFEPIPV